MYLWFFFVDTMITINTHKTLNRVVLGNIETGILVDYILITIFWPKLAAIVDIEVLFDM